MNCIKAVEPYTPIQYITGSAEFCGLDFRVDHRVLIPRPETELLVEAVIEIAAFRGTRTETIKILDLCTGSGNIAVALAVRLRPSTLSETEGLTKSISNCRITASDISPDAIEVARLNAIRNGVYDEIEFKKSDLLLDVDGRFDIIVSNPPYIARDEFPSLQEEVKREPRIALDGGEDGLDFYRRIVAALPGHLKRGGSLVMEIGYGQRAALAGIIGDSGLFRLSDIKRDHNGIDRVVIAEWIN